MADLELTIALYDEADVPPAARAAAGALLAATFDFPAAIDRAWTQMRPEFRHLVYAGDEFVGQRAVIHVPCTADVRVYGFADIVIAEAWRGRGLARTITAEAIHEAERRGGELLLTATRPMRSIYLDLGFKPLAPFRCYYLTRYACEREADWLARWVGPRSRPATPLELAGPF